MVSLKIVFETMGDKQHDITINNFNDSLSDTEIVAELNKIVDSECLSPSGLVISIAKADIIRVVETEVAV